MKYISFLIKPASSLCNMRCRYCFYYDVADHRKVSSYGVMQEDTMKALIDKALGLSEDADITFAFQGGEPLLAGIAYFRRFTEYVTQHRKKQTIHYALQTNGTLLHEEWCALFQKHRFLIGVSLDAYRELHDHFRQDGQYKGTYQRVMNAVALLKKWKVEYNILCVLTSAAAKHPQKIFQFLRRQQISYVQFIPCLPSLEETETEFSLKPPQFYHFYKTFFALWLREYKKGTYISVTLFDNLITMLGGGYPQQCGMLGQCAPQLVVEGNGDVFPCDFYVLDQYRCGSIKTDSLEALVRNDRMYRFLNEERRACKCCEDCPFIHLCHRGCKRLNITYYTETYCGYRKFLEDTCQEMQKIAVSLR